MLVNKTEGMQGKGALGFVGLGAMGGRMAANLLAAGYAMTVFDLNPEPVERLVKQGARSAPSVEAVLSEADVVLLSLPDSKVSVNVIEREVLPVVRPGQIIIDLSTVAPPEARRLAEQLQERGASLLDAPVAGGIGGAADGSLHLFVGGDLETFNRCLPVLEVLGAKDHITYGGPNGNGQVLKGVNQMTMGLVNAAYLESLAFGVLSGIDPATVRQAMAGEGAWRQAFCAIADKVIAGAGHDIGVKIGQFPYYLAEAESQGYSLPLSAGLYHFCEHGEKVVMEVNRWSPSFWKELMDKQPSRLGEDQ